MRGKNKEQDFTISDERESEWEDDLFQEYYDSLYDDNNLWNDTGRLRQKRSRVRSKQYDY